MRQLSPRTLRIAREVARTLFDPGFEIPASRLDWLLHELQDYAQLSGRRTCNGISLMLLAIQLLPLLLIGKVARFTHLRVADRTRYLAKMERSRLLAPLLAATKIVLSLLYFEHEAVLREAGVNAGCLHDARVAPAGWRLGGEVHP